MCCAKAHLWPQVAENQVPVIFRDDDGPAPDPLKEPDRSGGWNANEKIATMFGVYLGKSRGK
jgi:hypothetical protein